MTFDNIWSALTHTYTGWEGIVNWVHFSFIGIGLLLKTTPAGAIVIPAILSALANERWMQWAWLRRCAQWFFGAAGIACIVWILLPGIIALVGPGLCIGAVIGIYRLFRPQRRRNRGGGRGT